MGILPHWPFYPEEQAGGPARASNRRHEASRWNETPPLRDHQCRKVRETTSDGAPRPLFCARSDPAGGTPRRNREVSPRRRRRRRRKPKRRRCSFGRVGFWAWVGIERRRRGGVRRSWRAWEREWRAGVREKQRRPLVSRWREQEMMMMMMIDTVLHVKTHEGRGWWSR